MVTQCFHALYCQVSLLLVDFLSIVPRASCNVLMTYGSLVMKFKVVLLLVDTGFVILS